MKLMDYGYYVDKNSRLIKIFSDSRLKTNFIKSKIQGLLMSLKTTQ